MLKDFTEKNLRRHGNPGESSRTLKFLGLAVNSLIGYFVNLLITRFLGCFFNQLKGSGGGQGAERRHPGQWHFVKDQVRLQRVGGQAS